MARKKILIIEDEPHIVLGLTDALEFEGFAVVSAGKGKDGVLLARQEKPDAILLDLMLPDTNGFKVCEDVRRSDPFVPIIMLTARGQEVDKIRGLDAGADDYVTKPFKPVELVARVRAQLRRGETGQAENLAIGDVQIDVPAHQVLRDGVPIALTPLEFDLLVALARKPRQVFTRELLLEQVWGYRHAADTRLVNVHVQRLRAKIERDPEKPEVVLTVRGVGYKAGPP